MKSNFYLVYILKCSDNSYYTGITNDIDRRLQEHTSGINIMAYTFLRRPVKLVYCKEFIDVNEAIRFEKKIKKWSKAKKLALIEGRFDDLSDLSSST